MGPRDTLRGRAAVAARAYQLGNLIVSVNATLQAQIAVTHGAAMNLGLAIVALAMAITIAIVAGLGKQARGIVMHA